MTRSLLSTRRLGALVVLASAAGALGARAQGTLSTQGLGYPTGQLSTRALATGGGLAEVDPATAVNPASIFNWGAAAVYAQAEPEYRRVTTANGTERTSIARYPLFAGVFGLGSRWVVGLSSSPLVDRSWATTIRTNDALANGQSEPATTRFVSDGSINDLRLSLGFAPRTWFRFGVAAHGYSGSQELVTRRVYDDSLHYATFTDTSNVSYGGSAFSAGVELHRDRVGSVTGSFRKGNGISRSTVRDSLSATIPDRFGFSAVYQGFAGSTIGVRGAYDRWSALNGLTNQAATARDAWDWGAGADVAGPRLLGTPLMFRAGGRWRTLPYEVTGGEVRERSVNAGFGAPFARGRAVIDVSGSRVFRDLNGGTATGVNERAWVLGVGLTVHP